MRLLSLTIRDGTTVCTRTVHAAAIEAVQDDEAGTCRICACTDSA